MVVNPLLIPLCLPNVIMFQLPQLALQGPFTIHKHKHTVTHIHIHHVMCHCHYCLMNELVLARLIPIITSLLLLCCILTTSSL